MKIDYSVLKTHPIERIHEATVPQPRAISEPAREDFDAELVAMVAKWARRDAKEIAARKLVARLTGSGL